MVSATTADKVQPRRQSASTQMKRLVYLLSTTPAPAKQVAKKPAYLRFIEYV